MNIANEPFGVRLFNELRKLAGPAALNNMLDYKQLQELKRCDREQTAELFRKVLLGPRGAFFGNARDWLNQIRTQEAEEVAKWLHDARQRAAGISISAF